MSAPAQAGLHESVTARAAPRVRGHEHLSVLEHALVTFRSLLEFVTVALFLLTFVVQPFRIPSESMVPTLRVGDFLLVDKQAFVREGRWSHLLPPVAVQRGDLAVFHFPVDPNLHLVKRVVGLPGDRVRLHEGRLLLNGSPPPEAYAFYNASRPNDFRDNFPSLRETDPSLDPAWWARMRSLVHGGEIVVPPQEYFVLGDNRNNSEDSRYWGFVPHDALVGKPFAVYFSMGETDPLDDGRPWRQKLHDAFRARVLR